MATKPNTEDHGIHDFKEEVIELENNKIIISRDGPFVGMYYVKYEKGMTPQKLSGAFTTRDNARNAINLYLADKKKEVVKEVVKTHKE